jgi:hypothetical protein
MIEVWQPERSTTIIRLDFLFAHSDGLPCRSLWDYGRSRYEASTHPRGATQEHIMAINNEKVDEITLALLYLTTFKDNHGLRA